MIRVTLRRFFSTVPVQTKIDEVDTVADKDMPKKMMDSVEIYENVFRQQRMKQFASYQESVALNFAEMENGRRAILRANYNNIKAWSLNFHNVASFAFLALTPLMPSIFYAAGAVSYFGYALYQNIPNMMLLQTPRIQAINLLENGQLQIQISDGQVMEVERSDFKYGIGNDSVLKNKNIWCQIEGTSYIIGGRIQVNQQLFHEII